MISTVFTFIPNHKKINVKIIIAMTFFIYPKYEQDSDSSKIY